MKVTSLKDVETYIYSSLIMPLKNLNVEPLDFPSPLRGENGNEWLLTTRLETPRRDYRRNYQRTQAQRKADWAIILFNGNKDYVIGHYNPKRHSVKFYERPFRKLAAMPLLGKLQDLFSRSTPFTKVVIEPNAPKQRVYFDRRRLQDMPMRAPRPQMPMEAYAQEYGVGIAMTDDGMETVSEEMPF